MYCVKKQSMCEAPCLASSSLCYWCPVLPIQQQAWNKCFSILNNYMWWFFFYLFTYLISYTLSQFNSPQVCKSHLDRISEIHGADLTISAVSEIYKFIQVATPALFLDHISSLYSFFSFSLFVKQSEMSVWTVYHRGTFSVCLFFSNL